MWKQTRDPYENHGRFACSDDPFRSRLDADVVEALAALAMIDRGDVLADVLRNPSRHPS